MADTKRAPATPDEAEQIAAKMVGAYLTECHSFWPKGIVYQDGRVNELFLAFRSGAAYGRAITLSALQQQETRETALRMAGAAGAVPDPDVVGAPVVGVSGSDWECVGAFRFNNYGGWQQLAKEYEEDPDATKLYRKRTAGVGGNDGR